MNTPQNTPSLSRGQQIIQKLSKAWRYALKYRQAVIVVVVLAIAVITYNLWPSSAESETTATSQEVSVTKLTTIQPLTEEVLVAAFTAALAPLRDDFGTLRTNLTDIGRRIPDDRSGTVGGATLAVRKSDPKPLTTLSAGGTSIHFAEGHLTKDGRYWTHKAFPRLSKDMAPISFEKPPGANIGFWVPNGVTGQYIIDYGKGDSFIIGNGKFIVPTSRDWVNATTWHIRPDLTSEFPSDGHEVTLEIRLGPMN